GLLDQLKRLGDLAGLKARFGQHRREMIRKRNEVRGAREFGLHESKALRAVRSRREGPARQESSDRQLRREIVLLRDLDERPTSKTCRRAIADELRGQGSIHVSMRKRVRMS